MPLLGTHRTILPIAFVALISGSLGCAVRPSNSIYRLSKLDSDYFLLSPDAATAQGDHQTIPIPKSGERGDARNTQAKDCSIKGPWFSFYRPPGISSYWIAETPSALASQQNAGAIDMKDQWQDFEQALNELQQRLCFSSFSEYLSVKQRIAASVSPPATDALFYRYGYGPGGYVDLTPGMQLQIERDFFGPHAPGEPPLNSYQGTTVTYYEVSGTSESGSRLNFLRIGKKWAGSAKPQVDASDIALAARFALSPHLRLFLEDLVISGNAKSPAILIGSATNQDLKDATEAIESHPGISCTALLRWQVTCAHFDGEVTVSPMLLVFVNGVPTYVPIGSRLWFVLPNSSNSQKAAPLRTLRLQRSFQSKAVDVQFARNPDDVSQLLLFAGDRISWSRTARANK